MDDIETPDEEPSTTRLATWGAISFTLGVAIIFIMLFTTGSNLSLGFLLGGIGLVLSFAGIVLLISNYIYTRISRSKENRT